MSEARLQGRILKALRSRGGWWVKYHVGPRYSQAGVPDIIGSYRGRFVGLEVKVPGGKPTALQEETHRQMRLKGKAVVVVVTSTRQALKVLDVIDEYLDNQQKRRGVRGVKGQRRT